MADGLYGQSPPPPHCRSVDMVLQLPEGWKMNGLGMAPMAAYGYPPALRSYPPPTATVTSAPSSRSQMEDHYTMLRNRVAQTAYFAYNEAEAGSLHRQHHDNSSTSSRHRRDVENSSPHSVASSSSGYGSLHSPSPGARSVDSPSPTTESANKLYNLLKNPENSYNVDEVWSTEAPLNLKRKMPSTETPMDLSVRTKKVKVEYNMDYVHQYNSPPPVRYTLPSSGSRCSTPPRTYSPTPTNYSTTAPPGGDTESNSDGATNESDSSSLLQSLLGGHSSSVHHHSQRAWDSFEQTLVRRTEKTVQPPSHQTVVCLAKKNLFPVTARVSDWIVKMITFAQSLPEFTDLTNNDKVTLVLQSWTRLLLLYMAETGFEFVVTPVGEASQLKHGLKDSRLEEIPTMRSVELIENFIKKCQSLNLDTREYDCLKKIVLFNTGCGPLEDPSFVDITSSRAQQQLQEHCKTTRPNEKLRYSQILLCMPSMYSVNCQVMDQLFCKHITAESDMEVLLKEMLHKR